MKKAFVFVLIMICLLSFASCAPGDGFGNGIPMSQAPQNTVASMPDEFEGEWDIPSVRDPYAEVAENEYNMPVYRFDNYSELAHLVEIIGEDNVPKEYEYNPHEHNGEAVEPEEYYKEFFENYTLLVGCSYDYDCTFCAEDTFSYEIKDGAMLVRVNVKEFFDCECSTDSSKYDPKYHRHEGKVWVWIAVPKKDLANCESITFVTNLIDNTAQ